MQKIAKVISPASLDKALTTKRSSSEVENSVVSLDFFYSFGAEIRNLYVGL